MKKNSQDQGPRMLSRREAIWKGACAAVGLTALTQTVWDLRMMNAAIAQSTTQPAGYKALVCLFLFGGNDANNLLIPTDATTYAAYAKTRGALALPQSALAATALNPLTSDGHNYALHSSCPELAGLFNTGKLAAVTNVGTLVGPINRAQYLGGTAAKPPQLFSHSDQQVQWQTSVPDQPSRTGWGGRVADLVSSLNGSNSVSMNLSVSGTNTFEVGSHITGYSVSTGGAVALNLPNNTLGLAEQQAVKDLIALDTGSTFSGNLYEKSFALSVNQGILNAGIINGAISNTSPNAPTNFVWKTPFPNTSLGSQLKMIARLIAGRNNPSILHNRQVFFASVGGYDLHSGQIGTTNGVPDPTVGPHANLFKDLSQSLKAFYDATAQLGVDNSVTTFTVSDFGRTFPINGGTGSDHGWGSHQLVMGGGIKGQSIYGTFPTLAVNGPDDTSTGRWIPTTSVDEYSATLAKWFGVSQTNMPSIFPNLTRFASPDLGFMG